MIAFPSRTTRSDAMQVRPCFSAVSDLGDSYLPLTPCPQSQYGLLDPGSSLVLFRDILQALLTYYHVVTTDLEFCSGPEKSIDAMKSVLAHRGVLAVSSLD
jgi:hypothetical protein